MSEDAYRRLAKRLDQLPESFPPTDDGSELRLLQKLFSPAEAALAAELRLTPETAKELATRLPEDARALGKRLKAMARKGLIRAERVESGLGYGLRPFVIGIYEWQVDTIDTELAEMFEAYYRAAFGRSVATQPALHRVIPVGESVRADTEIRPYESAAQIVAEAKAWGVMDCICRKQQALIGEPCDHSLDVCMMLAAQPGAFDHSATVRALTREEAMATLRRAAEEGLVHSVSNNQQGISYICNCCTCCCGILRGMIEFGVADVIARSPFVCRVDHESCVSCGLCEERCPAGAIAVVDQAQVDGLRCLGCGVCTLACPEGALSLVRRPDGEVTAPPPTMAAWREHRAAARGLDLKEVL